MNDVTIVSLDCLALELGLPGCTRPRMMRFDLACFTIITMLQIANIKSEPKPASLSKICRDMARGL